MRHELIFVVNGSTAADIERQAKVAAANFFAELDMGLLEIEITSRQFLSDMSGIPSNFQADVIVRRRDSA